MADDKTPDETNDGPNPDVEEGTEAQDASTNTGPPEPPPAPSAPAASAAVDTPAWAEKLRVGRSAGPRAARAGHGGAREFCEGASGAYGTLHHKHLLHTV